MTGRPAETWRKFNFVTPPTWAYALLVLVCLGGLGVIAFVVTVTLVAQRASGYLPLTRSSSRICALALWVPIGLLIACPVCWILAIVFAAANEQALPGVFVLLGFALLFAGLVGRLVVKPLLCPRGKVDEPRPGYYDKIVEISNVRPLFVAAFLRHQQARAAQYAQASRPPSLPEWK